MKNLLASTINEIMEIHKKKLDMYCAAFLKEVGSDKATEFELVQEQFGTSIRWYFKRIKNGKE